jgi:hypothetical protein
MKPKKITQPTTTVVAKKIVEVVCWDCGNASHNHKAEDVARRCMEKSARQFQKMIKYKEVYRQRIELARRVLNGSSFKEEAAAAGIGPRYAEHIFHRVMRKVCKVTPEKEGVEWSYDIQDARANKQYWLGRLDKLSEILGH